MLCPKHWAKVLLISFTTKRNACKETETLSSQITCPNHTDSKWSNWVFPSDSLSPKPMLQSLCYKRKTPLFPGWLVLMNFLDILISRRCFVMHSSMTLKQELMCGLAMLGPPWVPPPPVQCGMAVFCQNPARTVPRGRSVSIIGALIPGCVFSNQGIKCSGIPPNELQPISVI